MGSVAWIVLTLADLRSNLVDAQIRKTIEWEAAVGDDPLTNNPFPDTLVETVAEVRTAIASNPANVLSATANSIPPECKHMTEWLIIDSLKFRFATVATVTEEQQKMIEGAKAQLEMIRNWRNVASQFLISTPTDPETDPAQAYRTPAYATGNCRLATQDSLHGL